MKMEFDMDRDASALPLLSAVNHEAAPLDWLGLRARLTAVHALRPILSQAMPRKTAIAGGSFDSACARALSVYGRGTGSGQVAVNPTALADGNRTFGKDAAVAGAHSVGD
jgi:hypothetical protein